MLDVSDWNQKAERIRIEFGIMRKNNNIIKRNR